jgi:hypothetical protein
MLVQWKNYSNYSHIRRLSCQLYLHTTGAHNRIHFKALRQKTNAIRAELIKRVGLPWDGDLVMFRGALLDVMENWGKFSLDTCPLKYDMREIELWRVEEKEWLEASESLEAFRQEL